MLMVRIRSCHVTGRFKTSENQAPKLTVGDALANPQSDFNRVVLPPMSYVHEQDKINNRRPNAEKFIVENKLNEVFGPSTSNIGIVTQGGMYNGLIRALQRVGLADIYGETSVPIYCLNVTYPLVATEFEQFCKGKEHILVVEEGQPDHIEQNLCSILYKASCTTKVYGKDVLPMAGEYTGKVLLKGVTDFLKTAAPQLLPDNIRSPNDQKYTTPDLSKTVPVRPPGFCTGCPERPIFAGMKLVEQELGKHQITGDIGCHLFGALPPFEIGGATMGYGLGPAANAAFDGGGERRAISILGDGGFWHNGLTSSIGNMVFNNSDSVVVIVDNYYSAATGGQDILSSRAKNQTKNTNNPIQSALKGIGVKWIRTIDRTYDVAKVRDTVREALTTNYVGPKVIVASSECMLNKQRRERPQRAAAIKNGTTVKVPRFGVDEDVCTGDHACMRLSGCPSLSLKQTGDRLRDDPVAHIDQTCVGCGNCGEVAEAAILCPSFYQADVIHNPSAIERWRMKFSQTIIGWLTGYRDRRSLRFQSMSK
jgi:indolepyruvate ferredoxin oxidoreductase alpha subunit